MSNWKIKDKYYFGGSFRDISEQKRAEEESERILNMSQDLICIAGADGYFKYVNPAWERMLGYPREHLLSRPFLDFIHPEDHHKNDEEVARLVSGKLTVDFENRYIHKDGTIRTFSWTAAPLPEKELWYCIGRDVTERKRAEKELINNKYFLENIYNTTPDVIMVSDEKGYVISVNKAVEKMLGFSQKELIGKHTSELFPQDELHAQIGLKMITDLREIGFIKSLEANWLRKDGSLCPIELNITMLQDRAGKRMGGIAAIRDFTERKRMEHELQRSHAELEKKVKQRTGELAKANKELQASRDYLKKYAGMLLSVREEERRNISTTLHDELGSMAISVDSPMSIAKEEVKDNNRNAAIGAIEQAQAALRKAVGDLRRLAADLRPPSLEIMGLTSALNDFIDNFKKHTTFKTSFRNDLAKKKIPEDMAIVIYRVIQEALNNITRHAKANKVSVRLYPDKDKVHLDITDDGVGFDIDKVSKRRGKLKIGIQGMRERVESMGGEFSITSAPRQGTQLKAVLPK